MAVSTPKIRRLEFDTLDSTNAEARRLAKSGETGPVWVIANSQNQGVGRRGRAWVSDPGNVYATGLYPHAGTVRFAARFSFVAALAVFDAITMFGQSEKLSIKWPNDVLIEGAKVAGILLESGTAQNSHGEDRHWVAVGIGINVADHPEITGQKTTHLQAWEFGRTVEAPELVMRLITAFETWRKIYETQGFEPVRKAWLTHAHGLGGPVRAQLSDRTISGQALGLDGDGALEIKTDTGDLVKIHAGDVFFS